MRRVILAILFGFVLIAAERVFSSDDSSESKRYVVSLRRCFGSLNSQSERIVQKEVRFPNMAIVENEPSHISVGAEAMIDDERVPYGQSAKLRVQRLKDDRLKIRFDLDLSVGALQMVPEFDGAVVAVNSNRLVGVATLKPNETVYIVCKADKDSCTWLEMTIVPQL